MKRYPTYSNDPADEIYHDCPECLGAGFKWYSEVGEITHKEYEKLTDQQKAEYWQEDCERCNADGILSQRDYDDYCYDLVDWDEIEDY